MRKTRNAVLGIVTMMSGVILAVPTEAAERYIPGGYVYKAGPERLFRHAARLRGSRLAVRGAGAAAGDTGDWIRQDHNT